ncbi:MAG: CHASE2 domain-containing protein, partial [Vampirovibrio sp.]|nr:CHASE2 domain-containing protein [Vampirovibrio sp.]
MPFTFQKSWILLSGLLLALVSLVLYFHQPILQTLHKMELTLLDARLRTRAETLTPSNDIVVVAMDRHTQEVAMNHPELGITDLALPRGHLAKVVSYLADQG